MKTAEEGRKRKRSFDEYNRRSKGRSYSSQSTSSSLIDDEFGHFEDKEGDIINDRCKNELVFLTIQSFKDVVCKELGKGTFGKVLKCWDKKHNDNVAIKIIRRIERYVESAKIEASILGDVYNQQKKLGCDCCVKLYSEFKYHGHYCLVFETLGISLYDLIKGNDYKRLPMRIVQSISRQLLEALRFLKSIRLIHTDLKLENILFYHRTLHKEVVRQDGKEFSVDVPNNSRIKLIDFGGATYDDDRHKARVINTRQYRGPEVTLELGWSYPSDVWSAGCIIAEVYGGELLFPTHDDLEHIALIEKLCGRFPRKMCNEARKASKYFHSDNAVRIRDLDRDSRKFLDKFPSSLKVGAACSVAAFMHPKEVFSLSEEDVACGIVELVRELLIVDPQQRATAEAAFRSNFFSQSFPAENQ